MSDNRGDSEHERRYEYERDIKNAVCEIRGIRVGDDDDTNEPERGGRSELLIGGNETRERGRHHGDEPQQNGGDTARDILLAGKGECVMGANDEGTADKHIDVVVPSLRTDVRTRNENGGE